MHFELPQFELIVLSFVENVYVINLWLKVYGINYSIFRCGELIMVVTELICQLS